MNISLRCLFQKGVANFHHSGWMAEGTPNVDITQHCAASRLTQKPKAGKLRKSTPPQSNCIIRKYLVELLAVSIPVRAPAEAGGTQRQFLGPPRSTNKCTPMDFKEERGGSREVLSFFWGANGCIEGTQERSSEGGPKTNLAERRTSWETAPNLVFGRFAPPPGLGWAPKNPTKCSKKQHSFREPTFMDLGPTAAPSLGLSGQCLMCLCEQTDFRNPPRFVMFWANLGPWQIVLSRMLSNALQGWLLTCTGIPF